MLGRQPPHVAGHRVRDRAGLTVGALAMSEIWTIGHGTRPEPAFLRILADHGIDLIADVRAHPGSRRNPQFGRNVMPDWLEAVGIDYVHLPELGGRRPPQHPQSDANGGWLQPSFRHYADYTLTGDYRNGIDRLTRVAQSRRVAIMCGESVPWRCHRLLIANTLTAQGWTVWHVMGDAAPSRRHELGQWGARPSVSHPGQVTYPMDASRP